MAQFKNGNILSLTLKNFQTFTDQKFTFGPSLNFIAAPNGSGKSSIANGMAFIFNGNAKTIGKNKNVCEFIKFGHNKCDVEAEVFYKGEIVHLKRTITPRTNQYFLRNMVVTLKDYSSFIQQINIDVNNLCSFLPQERVGEFCKMDGINLLSETLKSSGIDLDKIKDNYLEGEQISQALDILIKERSLVAESLSLLQKNAIKFQEKEALIERKNRLMCKRDRIEFERLKADYIEIKKRLQATSLRIQDLNSEIQFLSSKITEEEGREEYRKHKQSIDILKSQNFQIQEIENLIRNKVLQLNLLKVDQDKVFERKNSNELEIEENERLLKEQESEFKECKNLFKEKIRNFKRKMENIAGNEEVKHMKEPENVEELSKIIPSFKELDSQIQDQGFIISQISTVSSNIQHQVEELENQKKLHSGQESMRLEAFKKYHLDSYKAVLWLRENRNKFSGEILEPSYLHINIDKEYTDYVETFLSYQALTSFIVMNEDDFLTLARILKDEQSLAINIAMHSPSNVSRISQFELDKFGFDGVVNDFIVCRPEYIDFFNNHGSFNTIPISKNEIKEERVYESIPNIRRMAVNNRYSEVKRSSYDNDYVILTNKIKPKGLFNYPAFDTQKADEKLKELNRQREINRQKFSKTLEIKEALIQKKNALKAECDISEIQQLSYKLEKFQRNAKFYTSKVCDLKKFDDTILLKEIADKMNDVDKEISHVSNTLEILLGIDNIPAFDLKKIKDLSLDLDNFKRRLVYGEQTKKEEEESYNSLIQPKNSLKKTLEELKVKIRSFSSQGSFDDLPDVVLELETEIDMIDKKLHFANSTGFDEEEYKAKELRLQSLDTDIGILKKQKETSIDFLEKRKKDLETEINGFLEPIKRVFSKMFERFGFQGKLELDTSEKNWQLKILVKFRENETLQQLSSFRQSGGEKSLTTVLFLLSLLQCQNTAFSLVDEINQGMDPTNEKIVFEIIKEMGINTQFFVITPKMLEHMEFSQDSKAIIIYGGPGLKSGFEDYFNLFIKQNYEEIL